jgi:deoxyribonuclease-4
MTKTRGRARPRPLLGAHQSIAGGFTKAVDRAVETGCECLQIFTRNINQWDVAPIDPADADAFRAAVDAAGLAFVVAHDSYLINPASADRGLRAKSIAGLVVEIRRAEALGIPWVVAHPGAAGEQPVDTAVARAADGIAEALGRTADCRCGILIETTAGQGSCLGASFEEIATMLDRIDAVPGLSRRVGVCLDTCHVFAAGYPLAPAEDLDRTIRGFDRLIGLRRLVAIHANDSKRERGSRVDRHESIGKGKIGREAFRLIMNHPRLARIPMILETPKEAADGKMSPAQDRANLATLRGFLPREPAAGGRPKTSPPTRGAKKARKTKAVRSATPARRRGSA